MKRTDLNEANYHKAANEVLQYIESHLREIESFINFGGVLQSKLDMISADDTALFIALQNIWNYASVDKYPGRDAEDGMGAYMDEEILSVQRVLNSSIWPSFTTSISKEFWEHSIGYCCEVARARMKIDHAIDLSPEELSLLADRSLTTIQQHCQSRKIKCFKDNAERWKISSEDCLKYLIEIGCEPFASTYDMKTFA